MAGETTGRCVLLEVRRGARQPPAPEAQASAGWARPDPRFFSPLLCFLAPDCLSHTSAVSLLLSPEPAAFPQFTPYNHDREVTARSGKRLAASRLPTPWTGGRVSRPLTVPAPPRALPPVRLGDGALLGWPGRGSEQPLLSLLGSGVFFLEWRRPVWESYPHMSSFSPKPFLNGGQM